MTLLIQIFLLVSPVFLVIGLGFVLKRMAMIDASFLRQVNSLVFYVALPALLFHKIALADFHSSFNPKLLGGLVATFTLSFVASYLFGLLRGHEPAQLGAFSQGASRGNVAFYGLAVSFAVYGEEGFATAGILVGFIVPLINLLSVVVLLLPQRRSEHTLSKAFWMYQFAFNPLILASFAGIFWSYYSLPLPEMIVGTLDIITGMSLPLALLAIGGSFSPQRLRGDLRVAGSAVFIKVVLQPFVAGLVLYLLGIRAMELGVAIVLAGSPTAVAAYIMAQQLKGDGELSATIVMLSTLCALITSTVAIYLLAFFQL